MYTEYISAQNCFSSYTMIFTVEFKFHISQSILNEHQTTVIYFLSFFLIFNMLKLLYQPKLKIYFNI